MLSTISKSKLTYLILFIYFLLVIWWIKIYLSGVEDGLENYYFGFFYSFIALIGGINGLLVSRKWGGYKSLVGKGIIFLSLGLLAYWFGQATWSFYNVFLDVEIPYPSVADVGYFSSIIFYSLGMLAFARASGAKMMLKKFNGKLIALSIPIIMISASYYLFLRNFSLEFSNPIKTLIEFGTPLGYAIAISIGCLAFILSRKILGGKMKSRILYIIFAFIAEYITDFTFLYQYADGTYYNAGINDLMFATTFTLMAIGLISFESYE